MRIRGVKHLERLARWVRSRFADSALILGYHRVAEAAQDPYGISVTRENFAEQLEALAHHANLMPLPDLALALQNHNLPPRAVAITFDDGYADNLYHAKPLLERYRAPATVFVATGHLGHEFWWDELESILLSPATLPGRLRIPIDGSLHEWELNDVAPSSQGREVTGSRQHLLLTVHRLLMPLSPAERQKAIDELRQWAGPEPDHGQVHRCLTGAELIELTTGGLVAIGAHTVSHPILAELPSTAQRTEIQQSRARLEALLGQPVSTFSYPNGSASRETLRIVSESGFSCACASHNDVVWRATDPFYLPRFWPPNWDGAALSRWLTRWLGR